MLELAVVAFSFSGSMRGKPALRLLIVTAHYLAVAIITNEAKIVTYAAQCFIQMFGPGES